MIRKSHTPFIVNLKENGEKRVSFEKLSSLVPEPLERFNELFSRLVYITRDLSGQNLIFKAGSKVGVITGLGLRVQVCPKVSVGEFSTLIRYALDGQITSEGMRSYADLAWDIGFENALCILVCEELRTILKNGISRRYQERSDPLEVIRGRVLWERNFPWLAGMSKEVICRYHQMTYNNLDNQIVLSGLKKAFFLAGLPELKRNVGEFLNIFNSFTFEKSLGQADFQKAENGYSRLNEHYRVMHSLTKMLLFNLRPEDFFEEGRQQIFGIVLDMAEVFERFVERLMSDLLCPKGLSLIAQPKDSRALIDDDGYRYASVQPDIEVWHGNRAIGIIDAKYKDYWAKGEDGFKPERKISNEDLFQLFFYQQRMQRKYGLPSLPFALIAAPLPAEEEREGKMVVPARFLRVRFHAGLGNEGDVRLLLIPITRFLRILNEGIPPREAAIVLDKEFDLASINYLS
ncbi:MAG: hypothetical protein HXY45_05645 [Syntrophaceae bacterium]|nr:hypothetical protein [Syntrophaceae bacterium]